ncbi:MAG TPA: GNAT family N-acetyltransferase [Gallionella sp.]|nr:GNAT family N-acetyltransferase [Gallionella sp.]
MHLHPLRHMTPTFLIENISSRPDLLDSICDWHRREWGEEWAEQVRQSTNKDRIPTVYVAIENGQPIGTAMLVNDDMTTHPEISPWLGGVYVKPEHRGRGIATALSRHAMHEAARLGVSRLWLYTVSARPLYESLGWEYQREEDYLGERATIMKCDLNRLADIARRA